MALPTISAVSVLGHATGGSLTATMPAGYAVNDILVLCVEAPNGTTTALSAAQGFVEISGSPVATGGSSGTGGECQLSVFWKRAASTSETAPTISGHINHLACFVFAVSGCPTGITPFEAIATAVQTTAGTSLSWPTTTTLGANRLVANIMAHGRDNLGAQVTSEANASLASLTEQFDDGTTDGHGGGLCLVTGTLATAGNVDATTGTLTSGISMQAYMTLAFVSPTPVTVDTNLPVACFVGFQPTASYTATVSTVLATAAWVGFQPTFSPPPSGSGIALRRNRYDG